jgi:hypothetical protein
MVIERFKDRDPLRLIQQLGPELARFGRDDRNRAGGSKQGHHEGGRAAPG